VDAEARRRLDETGAAIIAGVERCLPDWCVRQVERILDAWGRIGSDERRHLGQNAHVAGAAAADRIVTDLRTLVAADPAAQSATPLEIVRTAYREPTAVLESAGIPPVAREPFDERAWPDDIYGLVPRSLGDLGDEELAPLLLAWGMAKARLVRP
jgi:hypothetical protein